MTQALGDGSQVVDPSDLLGALRSVDSVTEVGTDVVGGRDVTVYSGTLTMADYFAAMGQDIESQLGVLEDLGGTSGVDQTALGEVGEALTDLDVHVTVMVDEQNLLRRMETIMDMGDMFAAFDDSMQVEMSVAVWQEFDDYGSAFTIEPPAAPDATAAFGALFTDLVSV